MNFIQSSRYSHALPVNSLEIKLSHSCANEYISFFMVGELNFQRINGERMGASATLYEVHGIPTKEEEEER